MKKLIEQIMKFGVVGVIAFIIDYGLLMLLSQVFGVDPLLSAGISFVVSVIFNYIASMRFVFTHKEDMSKTREFVIFVILSVIGLGINELCIWAGLALLGDGALMVTISKLFATFVVMIWNFVTRKIFLDAGDASVEEGSRDSDNAKCASGSCEAGALDDDSGIAKNACFAEDFRDSGGIEDTSNADGADDADVASTPKR